MSILIPPKCSACNDTGEMEVRAQYYTKRGRVCRQEKLPCPFCENGQALDRKYQQGRASACRDLNDAAREALDSTLNKAGGG